MIGIYKYENLLNGKIYIGQSTNIEKRYEQHIYDSAHTDIRRVTGIDYAINKYGIKNFTFRVIEECSVIDLDDREKYWINFYDSYNNGYNRTIGGGVLKGEEHPHALLTKTQVWQIREDYRLGIQRKEVFKKYKDFDITERGLLKIWNGETWCDVHMDVYTEENKMSHKKQVGHSEDQIGRNSLDRALKQEEIDLMLSNYKAGMSINAIAKKFNRDNGTIEKYMNNPIAIQKVKYSGRKLKNLNTGKVFESISSAAKWAKCGATTLTRHLATDKIAGKVPGTNDSAEWIELS